MNWIHKECLEIYETMQVVYSGSGENFRIMIMAKALDQIISFAQCRKTTESLKGYLFLELQEGIQLELANNFIAVEEYGPILESSILREVR